MADDNDKPTITRRRALGGLATIGAAGALGSGTWAYFSDEEEVAAQFTGGKLDGKIKYETNYNGKRVEKSGSYVQANPNANTVVLTASDVKPGDYGSLVFGIKAGTNAAWVASCVSAKNNTENSQPEPEDDDTSSRGELADNMYIIPFYDSNVESSFFDSANPSPIDIGSATLDAYFDNATGNLHPRTISDVVTADLASGTVEWLDESDDAGGDNSSLESPPPAAPDPEKGCVLLNGAQSTTDNEQEFAPLQPGDTIQFGYDFAVPYTVGNEIQTDTLDVMFAFEFIQARHNENPADGQWNPGANTDSTTSS